MILPAEDTRTANKSGCRHAGGANTTTNSAQSHPDAQMVRRQRRVVQSCEAGGQSVEWLPGAYEDYGMEVRLPSRARDKCFVVPGGKIVVFVVHTYS
jgi:hypothetical protein